RWSCVAREKSGNVLRGGRGMAFSYGSLLDASGVDNALAHLQGDTSQRAAWGSGKGTAGVQVEDAFVAGAVKLTGGHVGNDRTGEMGALLFVGNECFLVHTHQQPAVAAFRIVEDEAVANLKLVNVSNSHLLRVLAIGQQTAYQEP